MMLFMTENVLSIDPATLDKDKKKDMSDTIECMKEGYTALKKSHMEHINHMRSLIRKEEAAIKQIDQWMDSLESKEKILSKGK